MKETLSSSQERRLLLHAPTGRDAQLLYDLLTRAQLAAAVCLGIEQLCSELELGVGAVLVAEEALTTNAIERLSKTLERQGAWSDVPLIVFTVSGDPTAATRHRIRRLEPLGDITLLERPVRSDTIVSAAKAALRSRQKQYELRRRDAELQLVTDNVPVLISYIDDQQTYRRVNRTYVDWFDREQRQIIGKTIRDIVGEPHFSVAQPYIARVLKGETVSFESQVRRANGQLRDVAASYAPDVRIDGSVTGFVALVQDITERKQRETELERYNEELQQTNRELQDFAYAASHDLQEPLRNIATYSQLFSRRYAHRLDAEAQELLAVIHNGVQRMSALIAGLLQYSHAVQRKVDASGRVALSDVLAAAISNLRVAIEESSATIVGHDLPELTGDSQMLTQLFQNLIGNAVKYRGADPPRIEIAAEEKETHWLFSVKDNGQGFAQEYSDRIFGLFKRLHGTNLPGTGIGLAICRRVVERHGGRIWAESTPGCGAAFYFTLPHENPSDRMLSWKREYRP